MLFEQAAALPEGEEWEYDFSWAGERVLAMKDGAGVRLVSVFQRRDLTNRFAVVAAMIAKVAASTAVVDGVIRAVEPHQLPAFANAAAAAESPGAAAPIRLIAMDLLWRDGADLRPLALPARRAQLREAIAGTGLLEPLPPAVPVNEMLEAARRFGADGVFARRRTSRYRPFARTGDWVRVALASDRSQPPRDCGEVDRTLGFPGSFGIGQMA